jgi:hypothetical protein
MSSGTRLDRLLSAGGPMPPGVALEIVRALSAGVAKAGPYGGTAFRPANVRLKPDWSLELDAHPVGNATTAGDARALGGLLFELVTGTAWSWDAAMRDAQLETATKALALWPFGSAVVALVGELVVEDRGRYPFGDLCERCEGLRGKVGGIALSTWGYQAIGTPALDRDEGVLADSPDVATGVFKPGTLAAASRPAAAEKPAGASTRSASMTSLSDFVPAPPPPKPVGEVIDDAIHRAAIAPPGITPTPVPITRKVLIPAVLGERGAPIVWGTVAILAVICLALLWFLLH